MFYYLVIRHQTAIRFAYFCEKKIEKKLFSRNESGLKMKRFSMLNWNYFAKNSKKCKKVESECDDVHSLEICQISLIIPFFLLDRSQFLSFNEQGRSTVAVSKVLRTKALFLISKTLFSYFDTHKIWIFINCNSINISTWYQCVCRAVTIKSV